VTSVAKYKTMNIQRLSTFEADFQTRLQALLEWDAVSDDQVFATVQGILRDVRVRG